MQASVHSIMLAGLVISLLACSAPTLTTSQPLPSWVGSAISGLDPATLARLNPAKFFSAMSKMSPAEQRIYLLMVGEGIKSELHTTCNIFGGEAACQILDKDSKFAQICSNHPDVNELTEEQVDCAYFSEPLGVVDPTASLKQDLSANHAFDLEQACPQCFENQQKLWCAQTAPKCGSFQSLVGDAVIPALAQVSKSLSKGRNELTAIADATPALADAVALSLPCREMCEAVVSSCSCVKISTFGHVLQSVLDDKNLRITQGIPSHLTKQVFGSLLDRPLCSLFASSNSTGFAGHCDDMPSRCSDENRWCQSSSNPGPKFVEQQLAVQIAKSLYGWIGNPDSGLLGDRQAAEEVAGNRDIKQLEQKYIRKAQRGVTEKSRQSKAATGGTSAGVIVLILCLVLVSGSFIALAVHNYYLKKSYVLRDNLGYAEIPLQATEATANLLYTVDSGQNADSPR